MGAVILLLIIIIVLCIVLLYKRSHRREAFHVYGSYDTSTQNSYITVKRKPTNDVTKNETADNLYTTIIPNSSCAVPTIPCSKTSENTVQPVEHSDAVKHTDTDISNGLSTEDTAPLKAHQSSRNATTPNQLDYDNDSSQLLHNTATMHYYWWCKRMV